MKTKDQTVGSRTFNCRSSVTTLGAVVAPNCNCTPGGCGGAHCLNRQPRQRCVLACYFASERVTELAQADPHGQALRQPRHRHEVHRELKLTPHKAWDLAHHEKRSVRHHQPNCPWWPLVGSRCIQSKVGPGGRVPIGAQLLRVKAAPRSKVILCHHPSGHHSVLAAPPNPEARPIILFSNLPQLPEPVLLATVSHLSDSENYTTAKIIKMRNSDYFVDLVGK